MKNLKTILRKAVLLSFITSIGFGTVKATEADTEQLLNMSLEELMNMDVEVASKTAQKQEEAPSIVTVIPRKQIELFGARDIADVLRMIPGFEFGLDVGSIAGMYFRGTWAHEGKALLMVNNIPVNDQAYGNNNFIGNLPINSVEKVEVIRGPGSVLYGGFAEVAVINIVTSDGADLQGVKAQADLGLMGDDVFTRMGSVSVGYNANDLDISAHVGGGMTTMSNKENKAYIVRSPGFYTDKSLETLKMDEDNAYRNPYYIFVNAKYKDLKVGFVRNSFKYSAQNNWFIRPKVNGKYLADYDFTVTGANAIYTHKVSDDLIITPSFEYTTSTMIGNRINPIVTDGGMYRNAFTDMYRVKGEISATIFGNIMFGFGYLRDELYAPSMDGRPGLQLSSNPADTAYSTHTDSKYAFAQYEQKISDFSMILGLRYENTSFGDAVAPRLGFVYNFEHLNFKLLYGRSFRVPTPYQTYSRSLTFPSSMPKPETANSYEFEVGYKINPNIATKLNAFYISIDEPLSYLGKTDSYTNYGEIHTMGLEGELKIVYETIGGYLNFAYARPTGNTSAILKSADDESFLGFPGIKINGGMYYSLGFMSIAPSLTFLGERTGITQAYAEAAWAATDVSTVPLATQKYDPLVMLNLSVLVPNLLKNFDIKLTGYNITNANYTLIQAYYDVSAPLPANDRHFVLSLAYKFK